MTRLGWLLIVFIQLFIINGERWRDLSVERLNTPQPFELLRVERAPRSPQEELLPASSFVSDNLQDIQHDDTFRVTFKAFNRILYLHLHLNGKLACQDAVVRTQGTDGSLTTKPLKSLSNTYSGKVYNSLKNSNLRWKKVTSGNSSLQNDSIPHAGTARLVIIYEKINDKSSTPKALFDGYYSLGVDQIFQVVPTHVQYTDRRNEYPNATMVVFRDETNIVPKRNMGNLMDDVAIMSSSTKSYPYDYKNGEFGIQTQPKSSQSYTDDGIIIVRSPQQSRFKPSAARGAIIVCSLPLQEMKVRIVVDCSFARTFKYNVDAITSEVTKIWGGVNELFASQMRVNLRIELVDVRMKCGPQLWNQDCNNIDMLDRLKDFSLSRNNNPSEEGLWHLMSSCPMKNTIGMAWIKKVCGKNPATGKYSIHSSASMSASRDWKVAAHEIGHNFGAQHRCDQQQCTQTRNTGMLGGERICIPCQPSCGCPVNDIMRPFIHAMGSKFSQQSVQGMCQYVSELQQKFPTCLSPYVSKKKNTTAKHTKGTTVIPDTKDTTSTSNTSGITAPKDSQFTIDSLPTKNNKTIANTTKSIVSRTPQGSPFKKVAIKPSYIDRIKSFFRRK